MLVLGIDPGPEQTAWALVEMEGERPKLVRWGEEPSSNIEALCGGSHGLAGSEWGLCVVEKPVPPHPGGKAATPQAWKKIAAGLIATALVAGEARGTAQKKPGYTAYVTSHEVRKALCGSSDADDKDVSRVLSLIVDGLPKTKKGKNRTSNHERDAAAAAIVGSWKWERERNRGR